MHRCGKQPMWLNSLRTSCQINWEDILIPFNDDIDNMWIHFKKELQDRILQFVPKQKKN